jgi:hypothetical protein
VTARIGEKLTAKQREILQRASESLTGVPRSRDAISLHYRRMLRRIELFGGVYIITDYGRTVLEGAK